jgi:hypothetical protein
MKLDELVMLLSTDWFSQNWFAIRIQADTSQRTSIREGCREIVKQILSGATQYWLRSFSQERVKETKLMLHALLVKCELEKSAIESN